MRWVIALCCIAVAVAPAMARSQSRTDAYLAARDRYIAKFRAHAPDGPEEDRALADVERLLEAAVLPWHASGFPAKGQINLDTLTPQSLGFGVLDGMLYKANGATVLVTTLPLLKRWLADNHRPPSGNETIPLAVSQALQSETFYSWAIAVDVSVVFYGAVPVSHPPSQPFVQLVAFSQDYILDAGPSEILVTVVRGERVFIAEKEISIPPLAACKPRFDALLARAEAKQDAVGPVQSEDLFHVADENYRRCFIANIRKSPAWESLQKQAQALVDLLR